MANLKKSDMYGAGNAAASSENRVLKKSDMFGDAAAAQRMQIQRNADRVRKYDDFLKSYQDNAEKMSRFISGEEADYGSRTNARGNRMKYSSNGYKNRAAELYKQLDEDKEYLSAEGYLAYSRMLGSIANADMKEYDDYINSVYDEKIKLGGNDAYKEIFEKRKTEAEERETLKKKYGITDETSGLDIIAMAEKAAEDSKAGNKEKEDGAVAKEFKKFIKSFYTEYDEDGHIVDEAERAEREAVEEAAEKEAKEAQEAAEKEVRLLENLAADRITADEYKALSKSVYKDVAAKYKAAAYFNGLNKQIEDELSEKKNAGEDYENLFEVEDKDSIKIPSAATDFFTKVSNFLLKSNVDEFLGNFTVTPTDDSLYISYDKATEYMTDAEKGIFNYLLNTKGAEAAYEYREMLNSEQSYFAGMGTRKGYDIYEKYLKDHPVRSELYSVYTGTVGYFNNAANIPNMLMGTDIPPAQNTERAAYSYAMDDMGEFGKTVGDLGVNIGNMLPSVLLAKLGGAAFGSAGAATGINAGSVGLTAASQAYESAIAEGYDAKQAQGYGAMNGASEALLEKLLGGITGMTGVVTGSGVEKLLSKVDNVLGRLLISGAAEMAGEFSEEYLQEILDPVFRNVCLDENNEIKLFTEEALYAGFLGALSAAAMNSIPNTANAVEYSAEKKSADISAGADVLSRFESPAAYADYIRQELGLSEESYKQLFSQADEVAKISGADGEYKSRDYRKIGKLSTASEAAVISDTAEATRSEIQRELEDRGLSKEEAAKYADEINKVYYNKDKKGSSSKIIAENATAEILSKELGTISDDTRTEVRTRIEDAALKKTEERLGALHEYGRTAEADSADGEADGGEATAAEVDDENIRHGGKVGEIVGKNEAGETLVKLDGKTTPISKIAFSDDTEAVLYSAAEGMSDESANAMIKEARADGLGGERAKAFASSWKYAYNMGYAKRSFNETLQAMNGFEISKEQIRAAHASGAEAQARFERDAERMKASERGRGKGSVRYKNGAKAKATREQQFIAEVLSEAGYNITFENSASYDPGASNDEKISFSKEKSYRQQLDSVLNGTFDRTNAVYMGETPQILADIGLNGELPLLTSARHLRNANKPKDSSKHLHGLTKEQLASIPTKISDPVMIMDSLDPSSNSVVVVTDMTDIDGAPVIVVIKADGRGMYNNVEVDTNHVLSYYGREGFESFLKRNAYADTFIYINEEKSRNLVDPAQLQSLRKSRGYDFDIIIRQTKAVVNSKNKENVNGKTGNSSDGTFVNGSFRWSGDEITINLAEGRTELFGETLAHELVHSMKKEAPKLYQELQDYIISEMGSDKFDLYVEKNMDIGYSYADAVDEVVARSCSEMLENSKALEKFAAGHMNVFEKMAKAVKDFVAKIANALKSLYGDRVSSMPAEAREMMQAAEGLQEIFDRVLEGTLDSISERVYDKSAKAENKKSAALQSNAEEIGVKLSKGYKEDYDKPITVSDVETLRNIGRKSINEFTDEDIQKSAKWAYKFYKEMKIKSPFFRAWFGDWRAHDATPYSPVEHDVDSVLSSGKATNTDTDKVISCSGIVKRETVNHAVKDKIAVEALDDMFSIIRNAVLLDSHISMRSSKSKMQNTAFMHSFYTVYKNSTREYLLKLYVEEAMSNNGTDIFTRAYQLKDIEKVADITNSVHSKNGGLTEVKPTTSVKSISDLYKLVKQYDKNFTSKEVNPALLNKDGTPKVFYHQTENDFTIFDVDKKGAGTRDNETPFGIFLKGSDNDIGLKGKKQMPLYVRAESPLTVKNRGELVNKIKGMSSAYSELSKKAHEIDVEYKAKSEKAMQDFKNYIAKNAQSQNRKSRQEMYNDPEFNRVFEAEDKIADEWTKKASANDIAMKREIVKALRENKYDSVILEKDEGSFNRSTDAIIVLDNTQVKSATDNIGTFNKAENDIRYSMENDISTNKLIDALEGTVENSKELNIIEEWRDNEEHISKLRSEEAELREEIKALRRELPANFGWAVKEAKKLDPKLAPKIEQLERMQERQREISNEIKSAEKALTHLESTAVYDDLVKRAARDARYQVTKRYSRLTQQRIITEETKRIQRLHERLSKKLTDPRPGAYVPSSLVKATAEVLRAVDPNLMKSERIAELEEQIKKKQQYRDSAERAGNTKSVRYFDKVISELSEKKAKLCERSERLGAALAVMRSQYDAMANDPKYVAVHNEEVSVMLQTATEEVQGKALDELTYTELKSVTNALSAIDAYISHAAKFEVNKKEYDAADMARKGMRQTRNAKTPAEIFGKKIAFNLNLSMLTPERAFNTFGGYAKDSVWHLLYERLNEGQLKEKQIKMEMLEMFDPLVRDKASRILSDMDKTVTVNISGTDAGGNTKSYGLFDKDGKPVEMTRGMMLWVLMHTYNSQNWRHLYRGGASVPDLKKYYKGSGAEAYTGGVRIAGQALRYNEITDAITELRGRADSDDISEAERRQLNKELSQKKAELYSYFEEERTAQQKIQEYIESLLTENEKKWIKTAKELFDGVSKKYLNETTVKMYGFEKAVVNNYFPIITDRNFLKPTFDAVTRDISIESMGSMKSRTGASNPLLMEDITKVIDRQINNTARYCGIMPAIDDFKRVYEKYKPAYEDSVLMALNDKFGDKAKKYIENLIADLQGARSTEPTILDAIRGNTAAAVLTLNVPVTFSQTASYPTAAAVVGWKALRQALPKVFTAVDYDLINKWSPLMWVRKNEGSDVTVADMYRVRSSGNIRKNINNKLSWLTGWISMADSKTVGTLWYAAEYYVQDKFSTLKTGSDSYYMKVAEVFNEVVEKTQPNYSVMQRPDVLRNPNAFVKQMSMFMTQRLQNYNILYEAGAKYLSYQRQLKNNMNGVTHADVVMARSELGRAVASQLAAGFTITVFKTISSLMLGRMSAFKDDDDELTASGIGLHMLDMFLDTLAGNIMFGSTIYEMIISKNVFGGSFYGFSMTGLETFNELWDGGDELIDMATGKKDFSLPKIKEWAFTFAKAFGIPAANAEKLFMDIWNHAKNIYNGTPFKSEDKFKDMVEALKSGDGLTDKSELQIYHAVKRGDKKRIERIKSAFKGDDAEEQWNEKVQSALKKYDDRIDDAVRARLEGDSKEYSSFIDDITEDGFEEEVVIDAVLSSEKSFLSKAKSAAEAKENGDKRAYRKTLEQMTDMGFGQKFCESVIDEQEFAEEDESEDPTEGLFCRYNKDDVYRSFEHGRNEDAVEIVEEIYEYKKQYHAAGGKSEKEAAKGARSSVKTMMTSLYKSAYLRGDEDERERIKGILFEVEIDGKSLYTKKDISAWSKEE